MGQSDKDDGGASISDEELLLRVKRGRVGQSVLEVNLCIILRRERAHTRELVKEWAEICDLEVQMIAAQKREAHEAA